MGPGFRRDTRPNLPRSRSNGRTVGRVAAGDRRPKPAKPAPRQWRVAPRLVAAAADFNATQSDYKIVPVLQLLTHGDGGVTVRSAQSLFSGCRWRRVAR